MTWIQLDHDCITMNWILTGLNWTESLYFDETFVVIQRYLNNTQLRLSFELLTANCNYLNVIVEADF